MARLNMMDAMLMCEMQAARTITNIKSSGARLLTLINDILDAAVMHKVR